MTENRDIGNNYFKEKNYQDAIKYYSKAIELDSNDKLSYSNRSVSYLNIGEYKNALNDGMNIQISEEQKEETIELLSTYAQNNLTNLSGPQ